MTELPPGMPLPRPRWLTAIAGVIVGIVLTIGMMFAALNYASDQALPFFEERLPRIVELIEARTARELTAQGFVYYEEDGSGQLTPAGRFKLATNGEIPPIEDLELGTRLKAEDEVYIRKTPDRNGQIVGLVRAGDCVQVNAVARILPPEQRGDARSAGWLDIELSKCRNTG